MLDLLLASILATVLPAGPADPVHPAEPVASPAAPPTAVPPVAAPPVAALPATGIPDDLATPAVAPSIATRAFLDEIRNANRDQRTSRQRGEEERARLEKVANGIAEAREALRQETARLEKLAREVAEAREALRIETVRVEKRTKDPEAAAGSAPASPKPAHESLAKTLKGMRPEKAADVVSRLDPSLAVSLLRKGKPGDVAAILEKLKPEAAADLVARLARPEAVTP
jgi:flagellar motility protein MotE (MotC chaperone)